MKRLGLLLTIALVTLIVIYFLKNPEVLNDIWLWAIGLIGVGKQLISNLLKIGDKPVSKSAPVAPELQPTVRKLHNNPVLKEIVNDNFQGITIIVLRYSDDKQTTVGLLYLQGHYYCYTLEDTYRSVKVANETRIPAGTYPVDFLRHETELTLKYRERFPDWFDYHLEIKNVPNFSGIYIHSGGDHSDTSGCLLVSDSLNVSSKSTFFTNSRDTFKRLYQYLKTNIDQGTKARIIIRDENWFAKLNA